MKQRLFSKWTFAILTFSFLLVGYAQQGPALFPSANPMDFSAGRVRIHVVPIATGLSHPWSLAFLPDGRLLVAEQSEFNLKGRIRHAWSCDDCGHEFVTSIRLRRQQAAGTVRGLHR